MYRYRHDLFYGLVDLVVDIGLCGIYSSSHGSETHELQITRSYTMTHREIVQHINRIEQELHDLKKALDPYADKGSSNLFDALENARASLETLRLS